MTITLAYREKWRAAIGRCMEQKTYGDSETCELCIAAGTSIDGLADCTNCVCDRYGGSKWVMNSGGPSPCEEIMYGAACKFASVPVRRVLREMQEWLENQEVVG
jgi:hypothetical protein